MAITSADIADKKAEITGAESYFELEDLVIDDRTYKVYKHAPKTTIQVLQNSRGHGDSDFIVFEGRRYTYNQFFVEVDALAASLQNHYGVTKGDRDAIAMRNNPEWAMAFCAVTLVGAIVVPINSWGKTEELQYAITDCGAMLLICDQPRFGLIDGIFADFNMSAIVVPERSDFQTRDGVSLFAEATAQGREQDYEIADVAPEDGALIMYTSGSTGFPKGVVPTKNSIH